MSIETLLREAVARGTLRDLDLHFARYLAQTSGDRSDDLLLAAALVSQRTGEGHVCVDLRTAVHEPLFADPADDWPGITAPPLERWRKALRQSAALTSEPSALVLDAADRLYLGRYHAFESAIADGLRARLVDAPLVDEPTLTTRLAHYFTDGTDAPDRQRLAARVALTRRLCVIAGGPGTGKTTTVTRILALLHECSPTPPRIALAAPTGKAAARLTESIRGARERLREQGGPVDAIPDQAVTLHRLLHWHPQGGFRFNARNPLHLDVLVVDEASMIDVPLMARLLAALPEHARLILLGDRDQLASVEAGSVLGDVTAGTRVEVRGARGGQQELFPMSPLAPRPSPLATSLVVLTHSHRFGGDSGIGNLARAINGGDVPNVRDVLARSDDARWRAVGAAQIEKTVGEIALAEYRAYRECADAAAALAAFNRFRFLCALRDGPFGVEQVNRYVEQALRKARLIVGGERHYAGRPVMITRNDHALQLYNGDVGLVLPDADAGGRLRAFFPQADGGVRRVLINRLPPHETVYAMTVHKSQGSEFDRCVMILPDADVPVLTRELIYTGVTRAKRGVEVWGADDVLARAVLRRVERSSGLRDALWES